MPVLTLRDLGPAQIERHVTPFALSSDEARYEQTKKDVALYRLTFGQPRQEDPAQGLPDVRHLPPPPGRHPGQNPQARCVTDRGVR